MSGERESFELRILPQGVVAVRPGCDDQRWSVGVASRFSEHEAAGLVALAAANVPRHVNPSVLFWRDIAADFLRSLCHLPENGAFARGAIEPPTTALLAEWVLNAPPMPGAEYLSPEVLRNLWQRLLDWTVDQVVECGGLSPFLETYAPQWTRVGRVTLHLAENKGDAEFPFAFMATYAAGLTRDGRVRRLPLGRALEEYAGARMKPELLKLLTPLHAAAKRSELVADLVETGDVFHPLVWAPGEAYAFLREIPVYEECGLFAQLPNWWRKRARPRVSVTLDSKKGGALGKDALLDFNMALALGDQQLSAKEAEALLRSTEGLVLLRGEWVEVDGEQLREALAHW
ncbi:MAG: SNF2 helicase-associated domain-containing protein, partial [Verrucomicrobiales bacterium]